MTIGFVCLTNRFVRGGTLRFGKENWLQRLRGSRQSRFPVIQKSKAMSHFHRNTCSPPPWASESIRASKGGEGLACCLSCPLRWCLCMPTRESVTFKGRPPASPVRDCRGRLSAVLMRHANCITTPRLRPSQMRAAFSENLAGKWP